MTLPVTSGLAVNYSAKALTSLSNGDAVSPWLDISGNANNANVIGGPPLVYTTGATPNGGPTLAFNNTSMQLHSGTVYAGKTSGEIFIVFANPTNNQTRGLYLFGGGNYGYFPLAGDIYDGSFTNTRFSFAAGSLTDFHIYNVYHDGTNRVTSIDGVVVHSVATAFVDPSSSPLPGLFLGTTIGPWYGQISEFVAYNRSLTTVERASVLTYLQTQYFPTPGLDVPAIGIQVVIPVTVIPDPRLAVPPIGVTVATTADCNDPLTVPPISSGVAVSGYAPAPPDIAVVPPVGLTAGVPAPSAPFAVPTIGTRATVAAYPAAASLTPTFPADGDTVEIDNPQFMVALNAQDETVVYTVEVQYADNTDFTSATTLTGTAAGTDGGVYLSPGSAVPATTYWRTRLLLEAQEVVGWSSSLTFTVETDLTPVAADITWTVDSAADRPIHLWYLDPPAAAPGDLVTVYGQGFPASGQVLFDDVPVAVTGWTRIPSTVDSTTTSRHIDTDDVSVEHYEVIFTMPDVTGPGAAVVVTA